MKRQEKELERLNEQVELEGELTAAEAIQKILQESELNDTITLQEASNFVNPTGEQRQPRISESVPNEIRIQKVKGDVPVVPTAMPSQSRDVSTSTTFVPQELVQLAMKTETPEQHYSQIWRIQKENAEIQKAQVELLRRMTSPVLKPPVFDQNILEYPKWENTFDALMKDQVVLPNYKLYYLCEYTSGAAQRTISGLVRTEDRRRQ